MFLRSKLHFYHLEALMWKTEKRHTLIFVHACAVYKTLAYVSSHLIITATLLGGIVITFYKLRWFMQKRSVHGAACSRYSRNDSWSEKIRKHRLRKPEHLAQGHIDENEWQSQNLKPVSLSMSLILFALYLNYFPPTHQRASEVLGKWQVKPSRHHMYAPQSFVKWIMSHLMKKKMTGERIKHNTS